VDLQWGDLSSFRRI